jgi:hypothetical protein
MNDPKTVKRVSIDYTDTSQDMAKVLYLMSSNPLPDETPEQEADRTKWHELAKKNI